MDMEEEREAFERWVTDNWQHPNCANKSKEGLYALSSVRMYWQAWLARAALLNPDQKS